MYIIFAGMLDSFFQCLKKLLSWTTILKIPQDDLQESGSSCYIKKNLPMCVQDSLTNIAVKHDTECVPSTSGLYFKARISLNLPRG